ncbi:hypothetical protein NKH36_18915 [Mesorhizobium sp. M1312]|uniref:hypothetical protein n=1 Tax=unclassified Mesorhizobium TaxID=325217 RepID=UPI003335F099
MLAEFERDLQVLIDRPSMHRPFVCEGSPLACDVLIVGYNPATTMKQDFWTYWKPDYGFDKSAWFAAYREERAARPLKPGKKFRPAISPTRRVLEWIGEGAAPCRILETNIFSVPSEAKADLALEKRESAPFKFLVNRVKPVVIIAHGKDAHEAVAQLETSATVFNVSHLSRGWSQEKAKRLGNEIQLIARG